MGYSCSVFFHSRAGIDLHNCRVYFAIMNPKEQKPADSKVAKKREAAQIKNVRVTKSTRNKLNALIQLGKVENVDILIDIQE